MSHLGFLSFPGTGHLRNLTFQPRNYRLVSITRVRSLTVGVGSRSIFHGTGFENLAPLAGNPIVVPYAPQLELLRRSALTITHGDLNTVLQALSVGVPLVVIPMTNDQPGVGARVEWTGTGKAIPVQHATAQNLRRAICRVLEIPNYRKAARFLETRIAEANGLERAADIVEKALGLTVSNDFSKPMLFHSCPRAARQIQRFSRLSPDITEGP